MAAIIISPQSKEQLNIFEALAKAFNIPFQIMDEEAIEYELMLKESYQQAKDGNVTNITIEDLWK